MRNLKLTLEVDHLENKHSRGYWKEPRGKIPKFWYWKAHQKNDEGVKIPLSQVNKKFLYKNCEPEQSGISTLKERRVLRKIER